MKIILAICVFVVVGLVFYFALSVSNPSLQSKGILQNDIEKENAIKKQVELDSILDLIRVRNELDEVKKFFFMFRKRYNTHNNYHKWLKSHHSYHAMGNKTGYGICDDLCTGKCPENCKYTHMKPVISKYKHPLLVNRNWVYP